MSLNEILIGKWDAQCTPEQALVSPEENPLIATRNQFVASIENDAKRIGLGGKIIDKLKSPKVLVPLVAGGITLGLFLPGLFEAYALGMTGKAALMYTLGSTPLSAIWENVTNLNSIIADALRGSVKPLIELAGKYMFALRATLIPAITSAGLVSGFLGIAERAKRMGEAIKKGIAPIERQQPQVFALFGEATYAGDAFYHVNKNHVIPIVENPDAMRKVLSDKEEKGAFLTIPNQEYGAVGLRGPWRLLKFNKRWLVPTKQGKLLIVHGFGETQDEELPLRDEPLVDLTVEELLLATKNIQQQAELSGVKPDKTVTIYLGNPERKRVRGTSSGLKEVSDREVAQGTVDIYVDTGKTLVYALKKQIGDSSVSFETGIPEYWTGMQKLARTYGLTMHDAGNPDPGTAPMLVYEKNTDESVSSALALKKKFPHRRIIVLTSSVASNEQAKKAGLESFCTAEILAIELYTVQQRLVNGETAESIQQSLLQMRTEVF